MLTATLSSVIACCLHMTWIVRHGCCTHSLLTPGLADTHHKARLHGCTLSTAASNCCTSHQKHAVQAHLARRACPWVQVLCGSCFATSWAKLTYSWPCSSQICSGKEMQSCIGSCQYQEAWWGLNIHKTQTDELRA